MMDQVKIMVDEQTKLTLKQLQDSLAVLLAPLEKLNALQSTAGTGEVGKTEEAIRRLSRDLEDGIDGISRKIGDVLTAQEDLFARMAALGKRQDELVQAVQAITAHKAAAPTVKADAKPACGDKPMALKAKVKAPPKPSRKAQKKRRLRA